MAELKRCDWAGTDPLYCTYHDTEWGRPVHDDRVLFEFLVLEGFQAGLSWLTILKKRENFRFAFANWDWEKVAQFTNRDKERLLVNAGIVRNRLKIDAAIRNAKGYIAVRSEFGSFDNFLWSFVGDKPVVPSIRPGTFKELPTRTALSDALSKSLKKRGFSFVGSTICYAFMQAVGLIDDHQKHCFVTGKH